MEYNLQKTLNSDDFDYDSTHAIDFEIEQYDEITPGIGQIVQIDNIIVPIYHTSDLTTIVKDDNSEQLGAGINDNAMTENNESTETENEVIMDNNTSKESENGENGKKRKIMDDGIHSSFLHPKMFKTKTLSLNVESSNENHKNVKKKEVLKEGKKSLKHKFNIY